MSAEKKRELWAMEDDTLVALADQRRSGDDLTHWEASFNWELILAELRRRPHLKGKY